MLHKGCCCMRITESLIDKKQNYINYWTAESSYRDLAKFVSSYTAKKQDSSGVTYSADEIFKRDFDNEDECIDNYCIRSKIVKMATEVCELYCKAILIERGKNWGQLKDIGHNLLDCYNALDDDDKILIESVPLDYIMGNPMFYAFIISPPVGCERNYKDEYPDEYRIPLVDYLNSFATGRILPNIRARYPGQTLVDFNEKFILGLAKLLHSFFHTKKMRDLVNKTDDMYQRFINSKMVDSYLEL